MQVKDLRLKRALRTALLVLLLNVVGLGKMYAYDFSAVCETGQTLYYNIIDATNHYVELTCPGSNYSNAWSGFVKPTGEITLPSSMSYNGITYSVTSIGNYAFYYCNGLTGDLTIPNTVTSIGSHAFHGCSGFIGSLTISDSVISIDDYAFEGCNGFMGSLTIGNSVTTIGNYAFEYCDGFSGSLTIPNSVTSIGSDAFFWCSGFTGNLIIPNSVTTIGGYAFRGCSGFTEVHYNATNCADANSSYPPFRDCRGTLVIGNNVERIPKNMFSYGRFSGGLTIPNSVTSIGGSAFYNCSGIYFITSLAETPPALDYDPFGAWNTTIPVYVPCGMEEVYSSLLWGGFNNFYGMCEGVVTVVAIPEEGGIVTGGGSYEAGESCSVTAIANEGYAFANWTLNGLIVSVNTEYTFYVAGDMTLVAHFASEDNIVFADANLKNICVSHWDTNGDGELSYAEAASVTSLSDYFKNNSEITSFEELQYFVGLTSIGSQAFQNCSGLVSMVLPNSVTMIGNSAFYNCSGLMGSLVIPNYVSTIGSDAFYGCSGFTGSLVIPNLVTEIGSGAFYGCSGFTGSLVIPNLVTEIGSGAFQDCSGFSGDLVIPNTLTTINNYTFRNCSGFTGNLTIPDSVTSIGVYAFSGCNGFTGDLVIPNSVTTINNYAFQNCSGFTGSLIIPNSVTYIGSAFSGCSFAGLDINMSNIRNNFVSNIGGSYSGTLTIGNSVTSIGNSAFQNCNSFTEVHYNASNCANVSNNSLPFSGCGGILVIGDNVERIPNNMFCGAAFTDNLTIPNSVTTIGQNAFSNCTNFTGSLTIGNSVTSIGNNAFSGCSFNGLEVDMTNIPNSFVSNMGGNYSGSLTVGNSVTTIGNYAFSYCSGFIGDLTIGNSVTTIGDYAFRNCNGFTGVLTIGNSVTSIGASAFQNCSGFTEVHYNATNCADVSQNAQYFSRCIGSLSIGDNVERIPAYMFYYASFTGSLTIPNSVTTIGNSAFSGCSGFTGDLIISNSVTTINSYAFSGCSGFTGNLTIPNSVISIGGSAFSGCSGFSGGLTIGNSVTTIGNFAFSNCNGLETIMVEVGNSVYDSREDCNAIIETITNELISGCKNTVIPNSVFSIGYSAFYMCSGLTSLVIPNSVTSIGSSAFMLTGLTSLVIPNSVTSIGNSAFQNCSDLETIIVEAGNPEFDSREGCNAIINTASNTLIVGCKNTVIPNSVTSIGNRAFLGCSGLTGSLVIPNSVISIGEYAFHYCDGLTGNLTIPSSVTTIGNYAFAYCTGFSSVTSLAETPPTLGNTAFSGWSMGIPVYVPCGFEEAYQTALGWNSFTNILGMCPGTITVVANPSEGGTVIGGGYFESGVLCTVTATANDGFAFSNWTNNGTIVSTDSSYTFSVAGDATLVANFVQDGNISFADANVKTICVANWDTNGDGELSYAEASVVTSFGDVFRGNTEITSFEELQYFIGLSSISDNAFRDCSGLMGNLIIPNSVTLIGYCAFLGCSNLTGSLIIPNSVTSISGGAFNGCSGFTGSLIIPNSVTSIGGDAFIGCSGFTGNLIIPNSVVTIGSQAFMNCCGFTGDLVIPNSVTTIGESAFSGCSGFTGDLTIPNSITTICKWTFSGCSGFTGNLTIPNSVTAIDNYAFLACSGFTGSLSIPSSVTTIGKYAFGSCEGLTGSLTIPNSVTTIGDYAFEECTNISEVHYNATNCSDVSSNAYPFFLCGGTLTIGENVERIPSNIFISANFVGGLTIPNSVTEIGGGAFKNCNSFTGSLTIGNSVTSIGYDAFYCWGFTGVYYRGDISQWCNISFGGVTANPLFYNHNLYINNCLLTDLIIPKSVTEIKNYAFCGCNSITSDLVIPNTVTSIGYDAFRSCNNITEAMILGTNPPLLSNNCFYGSFPIYVPYESLNAYKTATNWSNYEDRIFSMTYTTIPGYGEGEGNYRFIASPLVENTDPTMVDNMITETEYDLYLFDQSAYGWEWQNYKANTESFILENGQGYLYANAEEVNVIFKGEFNEDETKEVELAYDADADFAGWNLVGNPFPVSAYANKSYYTINEDGTAVEPNAVSSATAIPACTGVMVKADALGESVVFNKMPTETASNQGGLQIALSQVVDRGGVSTGSTTAVDKAIVSFNAGDRLEKYVFNKDNARISIPQGGKDLAIACADKQGEMPLDFRATKNGTYTLSVDVENADVDYLHLIDNLTGADIDLLAFRQAQRPAEYTFTAKTSDYASRFRLVFSVCGDADGDNAPFAFISNGNIIVTGAEAGAVLQIVDMTGRVIRCTDVARNVSTNEMTPGVYVLRLINGNDIKTQKIVID